MPVRPAATVMLVRDAAGAGRTPSLEVLMVRRNLRSDFVGGAYVFPGGAVDPHDGGAEAEAACTGRSDVQASALLGLGSGGLAYWVAVVRETFEEAGLLLAERPDGPALLSGDPAEEARFTAARAEVNAGTLRFLDLCRDERLTMQVGDIHYFAHWITPRGHPAATTPASSPPPRRPARRRLIRAGETIAEVWITPGRGTGPPPVRRHRDHLPDHPQPAGHQPLLRQCGAVGGGGPRLELGPDHRAPGRGRRQRHAHRPAR